MTITEGTPVRILVHRRCMGRDLFSQLGTVKAILKVGAGIPDRYRISINAGGVSFWFVRDEFEPV